MCFDFDFSIPIKMSHQSEHPSFTFSSCVFFFKLIKFILILKKNRKTIMMPFFIPSSRQAISYKRRFRVPRNFYIPSGLVRLPRKLSEMHYSWRKTIISFKIFRFVFSCIFWFVIPCSFFLLSSCYGL